MAQQDRFKNRSNNNKVNIDYLSKDFISLKDSLMNLAKSYFPNSYNDFNETSPGMMMIEMGAYVGDVLSYYIDHQYKEMLLPLSEERRNIINIASMLGYKVKPIVPAIVELQFRQTVADDGTGDDPRTPDYSTLMTLDRGIRVKSATNSDVFFETLDSLDFSVTGSNDTELVPVGQDSTGLTNSWECIRKVLAVSGQTKSITYNISNPKPYLELTIPEFNVVNVVSVKDSNGRPWYEVQYLAQDKFLSGSIRSNAYNGDAIPAKYELNPAIIADRRFVTKTNHDNTTSLVFGNGMLTEKYSANQLDSIWQDNEDINSLIQGNLPDSISPLTNNMYNNSLGEAPAHTTLTVEYRVGGGIKSNVSSEDLTSVTNAQSKIIGDSSRISTLSVTNLLPARGGMDSENIDDIKEKARTFFSSQDRAVTPNDYEARILATPSAYGNVAKTYVNRRQYNEVTGSNGDNIFEAFNFNNDEFIGGSDDVTAFETLFAPFFNGSAGDPTNITQPQIDAMSDVGTFISNIGSSHAGDMLTFLNINAYVLSYDSNKNFVKTTSIIKNNIRNYLANYKILSDEVEIRDGVVINFGVKFTVEVHDNINKADVKLKCIDEITKYFSNDFMQFNQIIYVSDLQNILYNNVDGIRVIHDLFLTQDADDLGVSSHLHATLEDGTGVTQAGVPSDGVSGPTSSTYGHAYITEFKRFINDYYGVGAGVILPPNSGDTPGIFELKNPHDNIKGAAI